MQQKPVQKKPAASTSTPNTTQTGIMLEERAAAAAQGVRQLPAEATPQVASGPVKPHAKSYTVHSPNGKASIEVHLITRLFWCVKKGGETITTQRSFRWESDVAGAWLQAKRRVGWK